MTHFADEEGSMQKRKKRKANCFSDIDTRQIQLPAQGLKDAHKL